MAINSMFATGTVPTALDVSVAPSQSLDNSTRTIPVSDGWSQTPHEEPRRQSKASHDDIAASGLTSPSEALDCTKEFIPLALEQDSSGKERSPAAPHSPK